MLGSRNKLSTVSRCELLCIIPLSTFTTSESKRCCLESLPTKPCFGSNFGTMLRPFFNPKWFVSCTKSTKVLMATNQKVGSSNLSGRAILQGFQRLTSKNSPAVLPVCYPKVTFTAGAAAALRPPAEARAEYHLWHGETIHPAGQASPWKS